MNKRLDDIHQEMQSMLGVENNQKTFVLLLAPSGAGKTTRIKSHHAAEKGTMVHIDRDVITAELLDRHGINSIIADPNDRERRDQIKKNEAEPAYYERLAQELKKDGTSKIIVDYPSGTGDAWVAKTIDMAKAEGWRVEVEGIAVDPQESLSRILSRNADGMDRSKTADVIASWQAGFKNWLYTYKNFPGQFQTAASLADKGTLFYNDNKSHDLKPVAEWQGTDPIIQDEAHYNDFLNLTKVNPEKASFTAKVVRAESHPDVGGSKWWSYNFSTNISDLYPSSGTPQPKVSHDKRKSGAKIPGSPSPHG